MPFVIGNAAAHIRSVVIPFKEQYGAAVEVKYNSGAKYKLYEQASQKLEREWADLQRKLQATDSDEDTAITDEDYRKILDRMQQARRDIADNICIVIEDWDLETSEELSLDDIKKNMSAEDRKRFKDVTGTGKLPITGAWLDALPLPDEFIIELTAAIQKHFATGVGGPKAGSRAS